MKPTALIRGAAAAAAVALVATACGTSETESGTPVAESSETNTTTATTSAAAAPSRERIAPRQESTQGPATTIADYIAENDISETPVFRGDPGAPTVDLPFPEGWQDAGADTPEWAYGAIYYSGPGAEEYTPSIVALLSRLTGDVDPDAIIEYAAGELTNLPGWEPLSRGRTSTLSGFPAYQLGGTWVQDGVTKVVAQKTAVIPGADGLYVLQLNADGLESQLDIIGPATDIIDDQTVITP
ncbi:LpqN/LpqT family lipoprotein [Mycolicibacterium poriferae]|uniref:LpqN/LpqT family lipoprotein n=1 Tax=Mycolicibacterium poriferae TaxID=39694 RepID=UPI0024B93183|nr:LpqN/LpqT family lipoprotein [Mycolicibacterium poriferae]